MSLRKRKHRIRRAGWSKARKRRHQKVAGASVDRLFCDIIAEQVACLAVMRNPLTVFVEAGGGTAGNQAIEALNRQENARVQDAQHRILAVLRKK